MVSAKFKRRFIERRLKGLVQLYLKYLVQLYRIGRLQDRRLTRPVPVQNPASIAAFSENPYLLPGIVGEVEFRPCLSTRSDLAAVDPTPDAP